MDKSPPTGRMNILLPLDVIRELKERVPARQRGRFIADAVARELRRIRLQAALEASYGAWSDEDHPDMLDGPAIDRWIEEGRRGTNWDQVAGIKAEPESGST
jgi:hypothetical protein